MTASKDLFNGYAISDINDNAQELFHTIVELNIPIELAVIALCRCITMVADANQLDMACRVIDELAEIPYNEELDPDIEWVDIDVEEDDGDIE